MAITQGSEDISTHIRPIQFVAVGNQQQVPAPFIRVTTCGLLTIEIVAEVVSSDPPRARYISLTPEQLRGRGTAPALMLLKLLVNRHQRFASKDWLLTQFCRDGELYTSARIENIVSILRGLLCPPDAQELRTHLVAYVRGSSKSNDGYQLAPYPLIWVDSEALAWNVEQAARMERFGDEGLPFWERAYELAKRGPYLPEEMYSEWVTFRREEVQGMLRQSVQALARLYVARHGEAGQEASLLLLRSYWQEHPREEDVLRPLMELLVQRERSHEALEYYERLRILLEQDGHVPDAQTQDLAEYVRTKQVQRLPLSDKPTQDVDNYPPAPLLSPHLPLSPSPSFEAAFPHIMKADHTQEGDIMDQLRRQILKQVLQGTGAAVLATQNLAFGSEMIQALFGPTNLPTYNGLLHTEEALAIYTAYLPIYWRLYFDGQSAEVQCALPACVVHLSTLASQDSSSQKQAASLASQASQLACMLALQDQQFGKAFVAAQQGFQYGQLAEDPNLQVASLIRKALIYFYLKRPEQKLHIYQEALQYKTLVSPLLQGRVYMGLVEAYGNLGREDEARHALDSGYQVLPERAKDDPSFAYTHFSSYSKIYEGLLYLDLHQPQRAWDILTSLKTMMPAKMTFEHVEFLVRQAKTLIALEEMPQSCATLETAIFSAMSLGSTLRYAEIQDLYRQMCLQWPHERQVKELADVFVAASSLYPQ